MSPPHHTVGVQTVPVQDMHAPLGVHGLRLLVGEAGPLGDRERHDPRRAGQYALPALQVCHDVVGAIAPPHPAVRRPCVAEVPVVRRGVRPRLRLVLRVERVVPAVVGHEFPVYPRRVETLSVG